MPDDGRTPPRRARVVRRRDNEVDAPTRSRPKGTLPGWAVALIAAAVVGTVSLVVVGVVAGLAKRSGTAATGGGGGPPAKGEFVQAFTVLQDYGTNQFAADGKYQGRRHNFYLRVEKIAREDGRAVLAESQIIGQEPDLVCYLADAADPKLGEVRKGQQVLVEGKCRGRVDDGMNRRVHDREFKIVWDDCRIVSIPAATP